MLRVAVLALVVSSSGAGCKDTQRAAPSQRGAGSAGSNGALPAPADAAPAAIDWAACDAALAQAATAEVHTRARTIIEGCEVCGDWSPILRWNVPTADGGPKRTDIEAAMASCNAFCSGDAKLKFLGTLDDARGSKARTPWRQLGEICKEQVSAVPDQRFMSAPYFALDRIARAASARGGDTARLLGEVVVSLPALTVVGTGVELPVVGSGVSPAAGQLHVTLLGSTVQVGRLPSARLGENGVRVEPEPDAYPGRAVPLRQLASELKKLTGGDGLSSIVLIAPRSAAARAILPILEAGPPTGIPMIFLAARALESPDGWQLPGAIRVAIELDDRDPIVVTDTMTVQLLADELARRASQGVTRVGLAVR